MTDRELLESAARAGGLAYEWNACAGCIEYIPDGGAHYHKWNPLEDDGSRYRLAKQLDIRIHFGPQYVTYSRNGVSGLLRWPEDAKDDAYAIVSAAAAIGEQQKGEG